MPAARASADWADRDRTMRGRLGEGAQRAAIVHRGGTERMVVALDLAPEGSEGSAWVLPVPASPEGVELGLLDRFPEYTGWSPRIEAFVAVRSFMSAVRDTQAYLWLRALLARLPTPGPPVPGRVGQPEHLAEGVVGRGQVEAWGLRAEVSRPGSPQEMAVFLRERTAGAIAPERLGVFEPYLSGDYALIVVRTVSRAQLIRESPDYTPGSSATGTRSPALLVEFPAERAFFPLLPTKAYGQDKVTVAVAVDECRAVAGRPLTAGEVFTRYYEQHESLEGAPHSFIELLPTVFPYTVAVVFSEAKDVRDDIWFTPHSPPDIVYADMVRKLSRPPSAAALWFLAVAVLSYLAGGVAGAVLYEQWSRYARLGLWNLLSLVGLTAAVYLARDRNGAKLTRRAPFVVLFIVSFMLLTALLNRLLLWPLG